MKNKKSQLAIIILVIFVIILIITASILIYGFKNNWFKEKKEPKKEIERTISIFAKVYDSNKKEFIAPYFSLEANNQLIKEGKLENKWNEFSNLKINKTYTLCYWDENNYRECDFYDRRISFRNITMEGIFYENNKKGIINVKSLNKLEKNKEQKLMLNISVTDGTLKRLILCTYHSVGIIHVYNPETTKKCSRWLNYTYDPENNRVNLTNNFYWCKEKNIFENCKELINENICVIPNINIPSRLKDKADGCFYTGVSLANNNYIAEFNVKTMEYIDELDYIDFYIVDKEQYKKNNRYDYYASGNDGEDLGIPDFHYRYNYSEAP